MFCFYLLTLVVSFVLNRKEHHQSTLCDLCSVEFNGFASEYQIFEEKELDLHRKYGSGETIMKNPEYGFHPYCYLCDSDESYFYDLTSLVNHCKITHFECYVCNDVYEFFSDHNELRRHIETTHKICRFCDQTTTNQLVAFQRLEEYCEHLEQEHSNLTY